jgi:hypothetical protein
MTRNIPGVLFTLYFFLFCVQGLKEDKTDRYCRLRFAWTGAGGHSIDGVGFQPLDCWDRGFESH